MSRTALTEATDFASIVELALICKAMDAAVDNGVKTWAYARSIIKRCIANGVLTVDAFALQETNRVAQKQRTNPGRSTAAKQNRFVNFEQRNTNYAEFEKLERLHLEQKLRT